MDQAEQLRIIKANKQIRPTARVITVTSGKGGVGKSNMSINLAIQFRKMGKRVVILDADFGLANIEIMFGAVPKHNLCDLVYEGKSISDIITQGPMGVGFISGGSGIAGMSNLGKDALTTEKPRQPSVARCRRYLPPGGNQAVTGRGRTGRRTRL